MRRGFTLIELMVALVIAAVTVMVASHVARSVTFRSEESRIRHDVAREIEVVLRQLRADLEAVGVGSGGAIAVDPNVAPWGVIAVATPNGGFDAVLGISGGDGVGAIGIGGDQTAPGSDVIQLVVPNPSRVTEAGDWGRRSGNVLEVLDPAPLTGCRFVYVVDHTAPGGLARSQMLVAEAVGAQVITRGVFQFDVAPGSSVFCARVSTYWMDARGWLRRTDLDPNGNPVAVAPGVVIDAAAADGTDRIATSVADLQVAYRVSAELFRSQGTTPPAAPTARWAFSSSAPAASVALTGAAPDRRLGWAEVREVRVSVLGRMARSLAESSGNVDVAIRENGPVRSLPRAFGFAWVSAASDVPNLNLFDQRMPSGTAVEPY